MLGTRYEEYGHRSGELPFVLTVDIERTEDTTSGQVNWHDNPELQWCKAGAGTVLLDGERGPFLPGDIAAVHARVIHHTGTDGYLRYSCLILDPAFCAQAGFDCEALYFEPRFQSPVLSGLLSALETAYRDRTDVCRIARLERIVLDILIELREHHTVRIGTPVGEPVRLARVRDAIRYIRDHFDRKMTLEEIAAVLAVDKYTLSREFKAYTSMTVVQYINTYRCTRAAEYMEDGASVSEAARVCGFQNMSFFTKTFRQYFHMLPSEKKKSGRPQGRLT